MRAIRLSRAQGARASLTDMRRDPLPPAPINLARIGSLEFAALFSEGDEAEPGPPARAATGPLRSLAALIAGSLRTLLPQAQSRDRAQTFAKKAT